MTRTRRNIQLTIAGGLLLIAFWLLGYEMPFSGHDHDEINVEQEIARIHETYGVEIGIGDPDLLLTVQEGMDFHMEAVSRAILPDTIAQIEDAILTYPEGLFRKYSWSVFVVGDLKLEGENAGGTYLGYIIIMVAKQGHPKNNSASTIHHEFSSLILQTQPASRALWGKTQPEDWEGKIGAAARLRANLPQPSPKTGFLSGYGQTSAENDFNVYAEFVFGEPRTLKKLAKKHPIIAKKLGIFINAYIQADPRFIDYFDKTGLSDVAILPPPGAK